MKLSKLTLMFQKGSFFILMGYFIYSLIILSPLKANDAIQDKFDGLFLFVKYKYIISHDVSDNYYVLYFLDSNYGKSNGCDSIKGMLIDSPLQAVKWLVNRRKVIVSEDEVMHLAAIHKSRAGQIDLQYLSNINTFPKRLLLENSYALNSKRVEIKFYTIKLTFPFQEFAIPSGSNICRSLVYNKDSTWGYINSDTNCTFFLPTKQ